MGIHGRNRYGEEWKDERGGSGGCCISILHNYKIFIVALLFSLKPILRTPFKDDLLLNSVVVFLNLFWTYP